MFVLNRFSIAFLTVFALTTATFAQANAPSFGGAEHISFGDNVALSFNRTDPGQKHISINLPNGLYITYGDILSFGDFYGLLGQPISTAGSDSEAKARFLGAFNTFALAADSVIEGSRILNVLHNAQKEVQEGMERGEEPEQIFGRLANEIARKLNCITGGGCSPSSWWLSPGRYLKLANEDFDHFGAHAWRAYSIGHKVAVEEALIASRTSNLKHLELAYAMNAFASHYLSDLFSAGHLRTPRLELSMYVTPAVTGSLLAGYMHAEENAQGLHVHNLRGNHWIAYGDHFYFSRKNESNRELLQEALQTSADEIFTAYINGTPPEDQGVGNLIPYPDEVDNAGSIDISPLFYWDKTARVLMRRLDINNLYDRHWTADWWGWSTLILLGGNRGIPTGGQSLLARSELRDKALADGLITDPVIIEYIKANRH